MTEPRFEELINLYLDNEIGRHELGELKHAIRDNVLRRQKFERACQLHQAARKALAARKENPPDSEGQEAGAESGARPVSSAGGASRTPVFAGGVQSSPRDRQTQAIRNASVASLAERQIKKGAASSVDLGRVALNSGHARGLGGPANAFTFFNSPMGMVIAGAFTIVGVAGLYLMLKIISPENDQDSDAPTGSSVVNSSIGPIDQKELMRELQKGRAGVNPAEAMHANIYQSAAGQPAVNSVQVDYSTTQTESASPGTQASAELAANGTSASVTLQLSQTTMTVPGNGNAGTVNSSQLKISVPAISSIPGNPDLLLKMTLPQMVAPPAASGNQGNPGNQTMPQVTLP